MSTWEFRLDRSMITCLLLSTEAVISTIPFFLASTHVVRLCRNAGMLIYCCGVIQILNPLRDVKPFSQDSTGTTGIGEEWENIEKKICLDVFKSANGNVKKCDNEKGVTRSEESTENDHPSALQSFLASFASLFSSLACNSTVWFTLTALIVSFWATAGSCFQWKSSKNPRRLPAQHQTADRNSYKLAGGHSGAFSC